MLTYPSGPRFCSETFPPQDPSKGAKWYQNGPQMEQKWSQNGTKMVPDWTQNAAKMEQVLKPNPAEMKTKSTEASIKTWTQIQPNDNTIGPIKPWTQTHTKWTQDIERSIDWNLSKIATADARHSMGWWGYREAYRILKVTLKLLFAAFCGFWRGD